VTLLLPVLMPEPALAIYCGVNLVQVGDSIDSLYANCGPPTLKLTPREEGGETWFYNQGPSQFQVKIQIFNGKITAIEEGDYGPGFLPPPVPIGQPSGKGTGASAPGATGLGARRMLVYSWSARGLIHDPP
jgi:hypothetical protein